MNDSELLIYQDSDGKIKIDVRLEDETVWLTQEHMAQLFGKSKKTISEHICNIFHEEELDEKVVVRNFRTTTWKTTTRKPWCWARFGTRSTRPGKLPSACGRLSSMPPLFEVKWTKVSPAKRELYVDRWLERLSQRKILKRKNR